LSSQSNRLNQLSLVTANFSEGAVFATIIQDVFTFLGGKPGEVVVVDGASDVATQAIYWQLFQDKVIDKLHLIRKASGDVDYNQNCRREYTAGSIASKPYLLLFKANTIPNSEAHGNWLEAAIGYLDHDNIFAVSSAGNHLSKHSEAKDGWYYSKQCNDNFTLIKRSRFIAAHHELGNEFILSGFQGKNPAAATGQARLFSEVAFERYIDTHHLFTLCQSEAPA